MAAIHFAEQRTVLHKSTINFYLRRLAVIAGRLRSKHFYDEESIRKFEDKSSAMMSGAIVEYQKITSKYRALRRNLLEYRKNRRLTRRKRSIINALNAYMQARQKNSATLTKKEATALEEASIKLARLTTRRRDRRIVRFKKKPGHIGFLLPLPLSTLVDSYPAQFFGDFLPEMAITIMIAVVLTFMAIELGMGRPKKDLALESLDALRQGLSFIIGLYFLQLLFGCAVLLFNGYLIVTAFTTTLKLLVTISGRFILSSSEQYIREHHRHLLEYPVILTLAVLFMLLLVGSGHLISAFLALVGFSLNLYVLVLFDATAAVAREAGIKYFYLSTVSSGLMLYGIFLVFMVTGTGHLYEVGHFLATEPELLHVATNLLQLALVMLFVGLFFKLSAFPGHL